MQYFHLEIKFEHSKMPDTLSQFRIVDRYSFETKDSPYRIFPFEHINFVPDFQCEVDDNYETRDAYPTPQSVDGIASLTISDKFYKILQEYSLMKYQHCDISLKQGDIIDHYNFLHFLEDIEHYDRVLVNFDKTLFRVKDITAVFPEDVEKVCDDIQVSSWNEFTELRENDLLFSDTLVLPRQLYFDVHILKYDLFFIDYGNMSNKYNILISEKLAEHLKKENITGIEIVKPSYEIIVK